MIHFAIGFKQIVTRDEVQLPQSRVAQAQRRTNPADKMCRGRPIGGIMKLSLSLQQLMLCDLCGRPIDNHRKWCPQGKVDYFVSRRLEIRCSECYTSTVEVNSDGLYECRSCQAVYCKLEAVSESDGTALTRVILLDWKMDLRIRAYLLPFLGKGMFPIDEQLLKASARLDEARARQGRLQTRKDRI